MTTGLKDLNISEQDTKAKVLDHIDEGFSAQADTQARLNDRSALEHRREQGRSQLLASLKYDDMNLRINSISDHSNDTFAWILDPLCEAAKGTFASWLIGPESHFWIQGKAGSGKSTLMKRIWNDPYTTQLLSLGADIGPSLVIRHSFWLSTKNELRKIYQGMLFSLIHGILSTDASAIDWLLTERPNLHMIREGADWNERSLQETLFILLANRSLVGRICIFLDALDEIGSRFDRRKTLEFIQRLTASDMTHVKICTSSRPDLPWSKHFQSASQLKLEDLTKNDIIAYARTELQGKLPDEGQEHNGKSAETFMANFVYKSEGVFLWAHLAINTLLQATAHACWKKYRTFLSSCLRV